ncbi:MAG: hypothetical protein F6K32_18195 [Desertifilum sp. SIO1I2]|nr:hypothetical protein [Desertifilum sp. SIO1I2]
MNASVIMPILGEGSGSSASIRLPHFPFKAIALSFLLLDQCQVLEALAR